MIENMYPYKYTLYYQLELMINKSIEKNIYINTSFEDNLKRNAIYTIF